MRRRVAKEKPTQGPADCSHSGELKIGLAPMSQEMEVSDDQRLDSLPAASNIAQGYIEVYGRQDASECLIFWGWVAQNNISSNLQDVTAVFERGVISASALIAFHDRHDLGYLGVGVIVVLLTRQQRLGRFLQLEFGLQPSATVLQATNDVRELTDRVIAEHTLATLSRCFEHTNNALMMARVSRRFVGEGYIDTYGYHQPSYGWFISGWVSNDWVASVDGPIEVTAKFGGGSVTSVGTLNFFDRADIRGHGLGVILHLPTAEKLLGRLLTLSLVAVDAVVSMRPGDLRFIQSAALADNFLGLIVDSDPSLARDTLRDLITCTPFDGRDTMDDLPDQVLIGFDETINCGNDSIIIMGWLLAKHGVVKAMRLRSMEECFEIDMDLNLIWIERSDVIESVGRQSGYDNSRCGFILRVPITMQVKGAVYIEVETQSGDIGFKPVPRPRLDGIAAIRRMLASIETQYKDVDTIYDHVLGPSIRALNALRLQTPPRVQTLQFGTSVIKPRHSVIVPLYGRIDFMEFQLALFATHKIGPGVEIIYVLDDPSKTHEAQFLAASLYERFRVPFKLLCLSHNVGFAPANNIGVRASNGDFICFMNSDVFPTSGDWLDRLAAHLNADASLGLVGPVLLFEDNSIQHQGISFKNLPQFGQWAFAIHKRKGYRMPIEHGLVRETAITGACILMRRKDVLAHGAFDETYIIGDFEDTDLCLRLRDRGLGAAVDFGIAMHHLERKSQASSASLWRTNLTLYNAWVHQRRWAATIQKLEAI